MCTWGHGHTEPLTKLRQTDFIFPWFSVHLAYDSAELRL